MPRLIGEPVRLNTSKGSANIVKELPRLEIVWPSQKRPKSPDSSQLRRRVGSGVTAPILAAGSGGRGHPVQRGVAGPGAEGLELAGHRQQQGLAAGGGGQLDPYGQAVGRGGGRDRRRREPDQVEGRG